MFIKVMAAIAVFLFAIFVGFFALIVLVAVDAQYPDEEPRRTYYYEDDVDVGRASNFGGDVVNDDSSTYISEMSSDADGNQSCIAVDVEPIGDGQFSLWIDTRCE